MARTFIPRDSPTLRSGMGNQVDWQIGERTIIVSGEDKGRIFNVQSEGMYHADADLGALVREGCFEDDPEQVMCAKPERTLWFTERSIVELRP